MSIARPVLLALEYQRSGRLVVPLVLAVTTFGAAARAQGTRERAPSKSEAPQTPSAEQLAERAFRSYEVNDFAGAVTLYMQAFQIASDSRLLYNVASIYDRKLHDHELAEEFYRRYLKSAVTEPDLVKKSTDRLAEMKVEAANENAVVKPPAPAATGPVVMKKPLPLKTVTLVVGGVGVVLVGLGAAFGISALSDAGDLRSQCPNNVCLYDHGRDVRDTAARAATASTVLFAVGGVLVGGALATYLLAPDATKSTAIRVRPALAPTHAGLSVAGAF